MSEASALRRFVAAYKILAVLGDASIWNILTRTRVLDSFNNFK